LAGIDEINKALKSGDLKVDDLAAYFKQLGFDLETMYDSNGDVVIDTLNTKYVGTASF
jgi:hypothetical protein